MSPTEGAPTPKGASQSTTIGVPHNPPTSLDAFRINEQREILNTLPSTRPSDARQVDYRGRVDEPVALVDDADVVDRNALMLVATEASVNMPTDHDPRANSLDRHEQLSAADVLHTT